MKLKKKLFLTGLGLIFFFDNTLTGSSKLPVVSLEVDTCTGEVDGVEVSALVGVVRLRAVLLVMLLRDAFTAAAVFVVGAVARRFAVNAALCSRED